MPVREHYLRHQSIGFERDGTAQYLRGGLDWGWIIRRLNGMSKTWIDGPDTVIEITHRNRRRTRAYADAGDYEKISAHCWHLVKTNKFLRYLRTYIDGKRVFLHRLLFDAGASGIDHRDGDGLNNRRANLRLANPAENTRNRGKAKDGLRAKRRLYTSRFKGVCRCEGETLWRADIRENGKHHWIGKFATEDEAARAYDREAVRIHGRFARLNFPENSYPHPVQPS